jgi:tripeptide aminopeptidase
MSEVVDRFLRYIAVETTSDPKSGKNPSSDSQFVLANQLADELREIGLESVSISKEAYVMACLPANTNNNIPSVGFIAHMDTSPDFTAKNVNPQFVKDYNGEQIVLNQAQNIVLSPKQFPELLQYKGQTLITTDGTTLLEPITRRA